MTFTWTDRAGQYYVLTSPHPIEAEGEEIALEVDALIDRIEDVDPVVRDTARDAIAPLQARLVQLAADRDRWNSHAHQLNQTAAADTVKQIDGLHLTLADLLLVVAVHGEHQVMMSETAGQLEKRAAILAERPTEAQRQAVAKCAPETPPAGAVSRGAIMAWLVTQPRFARQPHTDCGWFAWIDRDSAAHRLVDPLSIESEAAAIFVELVKMRPRLAGDSAPDALFGALNTAAALMERLANLQGDLERFDREANARDLEECKRYAADWRSKRKT